MPPKEHFGPRWTVALKVQILVVWILATPGLSLAAWLASEAFANRSFRLETAATREQLRDVADAIATETEAATHDIDQRLGRLEADVRVAVAILERLEKRGNE